MSMKIQYGEGRAVSATINGFTIPTDLPSRPGGTASAPSSVHLLLASLGTCAAGFLRGFCQERGISVTGIHLSVDVARDEQTRMITEIFVSLHLPASFPKAEVDAAIQAASGCTIQDLLQDCPAITMSAVRNP